MVQVLSCHHFKSQTVVSPGHEPVVIFADDQYLFVATSQRTIEIYRLDGAKCTLINTIKTVGLVVKGTFNRPGNYIAALEKENEKHRCLRVYFNWNQSGAGHKVTKARVAGSGSPVKSALSKPHEPCLEVVEVRTKRRVECVACCCHSGTLLAGMDGMVSLFRPVGISSGKGAASQHDFRHFMDIVIDGFCCINADIHGAYLAITSTNEVHILLLNSQKFRMPSPPFYTSGDISSASSSSQERSQSRTSKIMLENVSDSAACTALKDVCIVQDEHFINWTLDSRCRGRISLDQMEDVGRGQIILPSVLDEGYMKQKDGPAETLGPVSNIPGIPPFKIRHAEKSKSDKRPPSEKIPSYLHLLYCRLPSGEASLMSVQLLPTYANAPVLQGDAASAAATQTRLAPRNSALLGMCCLLSTPKQGLIYDIIGQVRPLSCYLYTGETISLQAGENFLYAVSSSGLETYSHRVAAAAIHRTETFDDKTKTCPDPTTDICLVGLRPFLSVQTVVSSESHVILMCKAPNGGDNSDWSVYVLQKAPIADIHADMIEMAGSFKLASPSAYQHVVTEAHLMARAKLLKCCGSWYRRSSGCDAVQVGEGNGASRGSGGSSSDGSAQGSKDRSASGARGSKGGSGSRSKVNTGGTPPSKKSGGSGTRVSKDKTSARRGSDDDASVSRGIKDGASGGRGGSKSGASGGRGSKDGSAVVGIEGQAKESKECFEMTKLYQETSFLLGAIYSGSASSTEWSLALPYLTMSGKPLKEILESITGPLDQPYITEDMDLGPGLTYFLDFKLSEDTCTAQEINEATAERIIDIYCHLKPSRCSELILSRQVRGHLSAQKKLDILQNLKKQQSQNSYEWSCFDNVAMILMHLALGEIDQAKFATSCLTPDEVTPIIPVNSDLILTESKQLTDFARLLCKESMDSMVAVLLGLLGNNQLSLKQATTILKEMHSKATSNSLLLTKMLESVMCDSKWQHLFPEAVQEIVPIYLSQLLHPEEPSMMSSSRACRRTHAHVPQGNGCFAARFNWLNKLPPFQGSLRQTCTGLEQKARSWRLQRGRSGSVTQQPQPPAAKTGSNCPCCCCNEVLMRLQSLLCSDHLTEEVARYVVMETEEMKDGRGRGSLQLLCQTKLDPKAALSLVILEYPSIAVEFSGQHCGHSQDLWSHLLADLVRGLEEKTTDGMETRKAVSLQMLSGVLGYLVQELGAQTLLSLLPSDLPLALTMPYMERSLLRNRARRLQEEIVAVGMESISGC